ncbi:MAG: hypothetical protein AAGG07_05290 [Planctomycetota bacterium]
MFAARVASSLEGGRAAVLPPERRARLVTQARSLGLREFDANLIVAIVQDSARTGAAPLGPETADRLPLVASGSPEGSRDERGTLMLLLSSLCLAAAIAFIGARWLLMA